MAETMRSRYDRLAARVLSKGESPHSLVHGGGATIEDAVVTMAAWLGMKDPFKALDLESDLNTLLKEV